MADDLEEVCGRPGSSFHLPSAHKGGHSLSNQGICYAPLLLIQVFLQLSSRPTIVLQGSDSGLIAITKPIINIHTCSAKLHY